MKHNLFIRSFLLLGLLASATSHAAQPAYKSIFDTDNTNCQASLSRSEQPDFQELMTSAAPASDRFFDLLERGLSVRFRNSIEVSMLTYDLAGRDVRGKTSTVDVEWPGLSVTIQKSLENGKLTYRVSNLRLFEDGENIPLHARPTGLNIRMAKLMVAITEATRQDVMINSRIQKVDVVAVNVIHRELIETLRSIGFQFVPVSLAVSAQTRRTDFHPTRLMAWGQPGFELEAEGVFAETAVSEAHPDQGRSMVLKLDRL